EKADGDACFLLGTRAEASQHLGVVDDGVGVRNRQDRAVTSGGGRRRSTGARLLVLPARRTQVNVRVDECRDERLPRTLEHAMAVYLDPVPELRDHAAVDP